MTIEVTTATHEKLMALCRITVNDSLILRDRFERAFARLQRYLNIVQLTLNSNQKSRCMIAD